MIALLRLVKLVLGPVNFPKEIARVGKHTLDKCKISLFSAPQPPLAKLLKCCVNLDGFVVVKQRLVHISQVCELRVVIYFCVAQTLRQNIFDYVNVSLLPLDGLVDISLDTFAMLVHVHNGLKGTKVAPTCTVFEHF